jgi:putative tricarboxylic transport membrane protein
VRRRKGDGGQTWPEKEIKYLVKEAEVKSRDIISSLFWMTMGIGVCYGGYDLELGTLHDPGSGFMFFWVGSVMIGLSLSILIRATRKKAIKGELKILWTEIRWKKIVSVLVALFLYAYAFAFLGFILSTVLLLTFLFKAVEPQRWSWAIMGAVISTLAAYGVFQLWLGSQLPRGLLGIG